MNWIQKNFKKIIYIAFLVPILTVAFVSISHVTKWYGISNPVSWAIYLSIGIEIAALSALAAISAKMGKKVYFPFGIVTLIQFIGNIFFSYQFIDINSQTFKDWVDLVDPIVTYLGVESGDPIGHKRFLSLFAGGMLPIISLSFLHMLVEFEKEEKGIGDGLSQKIIDIDELSIEAGKKEAELDKEIEKQKYTPNEEELITLEKYLSGIYTGPSEVINTEKPINPTQEELDKLEKELIKINEQKFGSLEEDVQSEPNENSGIKRLSYTRRDA